MDLPFVKGHGTGNDFVLLDDPDGVLDLTPDLIRALADRRVGIGGDGVIRVVRSARVAELGDHPAGEDALAAGRPEWFMDYWNADGSPAEMCGNGLRVFVTHLLRRGWIDLPDGGSAQIATRGGGKQVTRVGEQIQADLGPWLVPAGPVGVDAGGDVKVTLAALPGTAELPVLPGLSVELDNPHVVVVLPDVETLNAVDLSVAPVVDPLPPHGTNVELVVPRPEPRPEPWPEPWPEPLPEAGGPFGHLVMRVHERGVGETRSCGTGVVAAAVAARAFAGGAAPDDWQVDVPGGRLRVHLQGSPTRGEVGELTGPAVIVAEGRFAPGPVTRPATATAATPATTAQ